MSKFGYVSGFRLDTDDKLTFPWLVPSTWTRGGQLGEVQYYQAIWLVDRSRVGRRRPNGLVDWPIEWSDDSETGGFYGNSQSEESPSRLWLAERRWADCMREDMRWSENFESQNFTKSSLYQAAKLMSSVLITRLWNNDQILKCLEINTFCVTFALFNI